MIPEERIAIEILAAVEKWQISQFKTKFQQSFIDKLNENGFRLVYPAALYYGLGVICDTFSHIFPHSRLFVDDKFKQSKCYVSVSSYCGPQEVNIPLIIAAHTLNDNFNRDINNAIFFEAITGSYVITGFHIVLNIDDNERDRDSLDVFYHVKNFDSDDVEEMEINEMCRSILAMNFKRKFLVNRGQKLRISIDTCIKPRLCFAALENSVTEKCKEGKFSLKLTSNYKVDNSNGKRFFIGKLLYSAIHDVPG